MPWCSFIHVSCAWACHTLGHEFIVFIKFGTFLAIISSSNFLFPNFLPFSLGLYMYVWSSPWFNGALFIYFPLLFLSIDSFGIIFIALNHSLVFRLTILKSPVNLISDMIFISRSLIEYFLWYLPCYSRTCSVFSFVSWIYIE